MNQESADHQDLWYEETKLVQSAYEHVNLDYSNQEMMVEFSDYNQITEDQIDQLNTLIKDKETEIHDLQKSKNTNNFIYYSLRDDINNKKLVYNE